MSEHTELEQLQSLLSALPPDLAAVKALLGRGTLTKTELSAAAAALGKRCQMELAQWQAGHPGETPEPRQLYSGWLEEELRLLLDAGLEPDTDADYENVLWYLPEVDLADVAPRCLHLMLEHGADPNRIFPAELESLYNRVSFGVSFDRYTQRSYVQCWLLLMGYGGYDEFGGILPELRPGLTAEIFRDIDRWDYQVLPDTDPDAAPGSWHMYIFDRESREIAAVY